jgi:hypothetical protein
MAENYYTRFQTTVGGSGYTAGSGLLDVASTAGTAAVFRVVIVDAATGAYKALLKVTAVNSSTQYAVTVDPGGTDSNANVGDGVYALLTADALSAILAPHVIVDGAYLTDGINYYSGPHHVLCTLPNAGSFSWLTTQGGATETVGGNALILKAPSSAGDAIRMRGLTIAGGKTTLTARLAVTGVYQNYLNGGIAFRESSSGKIITLIFNNTVASPGALGVVKYTDATTFSSNPYNSPNGAASASWLSLRIIYVAGSPGTITFQVSLDDVTWVTIYTENSNDFFTTGPDQWGYIADAPNSGGSADVYTTLYDFTVS